MARKKSEFLSALGTQFEIWKALTDAVFANGGGDDDIRRIKDEPGLADKLAKMLIGAKSDVIEFIVAIIFTVNNGTVYFSYIGDNFKSWFLNKNEKMKSVAVPRLHHDLRKASLDCEILADIGGEAKAEVTLAGIYELLKLQPNGQPGALLTNGYANIFYVRDVNSVLRAVCVYRCGDGWSVGADSVEGPSRWYAGRRVFSC